MKCPECTVLSVDGEQEENSFPLLKSNFKLWEGEVTLLLQEQQGNSSGQAYSEYIPHGMLRS